MPRLADGNVSILEPVRNEPMLCFECVTAISTYLPEPGRNAARKLEIEVLITAGKLEAKSGRHTCPEPWWHVRSCSILITRDASMSFGEFQGCACCEHKGLTACSGAILRRIEGEARGEDRAARVADADEAGAVRARTLWLVETCRL